MRALLVILSLLVGSCAVDTKSRQPEFQCVQIEQQLGLEGFFDHLLTALHAGAPLKRGVTVRFVLDLGQNYGVCTLRQDGFLILVQICQDVNQMIDIIVHEWAHAMVWDASEAREYNDHGPLWGVAYARAYRIVNDAAKDWHKLREQRDPAASEPAAGS